MFRYAVMSPFTNLLIATMYVFSLNFSIVFMLGCISGKAGKIKPKLATEAQTNTWRTCPEKTTLAMTADAVLLLPSWMVATKNASDDVWTHQI